ncbi:MAG: flippase-like domain-containing protein [Ignavibacteria bacterium]|nr:flippase-like domain-containing protein [Ignavibacteria bacterium]
MSRGKKLNIIISTLLLALFMYLAFRNVNLSELAAILKNTNYLYVFIGMSIGVLAGTALRAKRWGILLEPVKKDISFKNLFATTIIGYMLNNLFPRSGEVVRPYILGKHENISRASAFATIIVERIIDTVMFLLMFGVALIYFKDRITNAIPQIGSAVIILSAAIFLMLVWILFMLIKPEISLSIVKFFTKFLPAKLHEKVDNIFVSLLTGFEVLKKPSLFFRIAVYSFLIWISYLVSTYIPFYSFNILTAGGGTDVLHGLWDANLLLVLINVAMFIPSPAATGPYHYICKVTLVNMFAVSEASARGYGTATHAMGFLLYLVLGIYYFIKYNYKLSDIKQQAAS